MAFSFFFRDAQTLDVLVETAMPTLAGQAFIHIWDAGCAHGAEPYSLAMLLHQRMSEFLFRNVRIHATDVDASFGRRILSGEYSQEEVARIPGELFRKYFRPADRPGWFRIDESLQAAVRFAHHDLLSLQPIREGCSLVVCKNVLLHFDESQRIKVLRMFHRALRSDGLLALEHTQKIPDALREMFEPVTVVGWVYRRIEPSGAAERVEPPHGNPTASHPPHEPRLRPTRLDPVTAAG